MKTTYDAVNEFKGVWPNIIMKESRDKGDVIGFCKSNHTVFEVNEFHWVAEGFDISVFYWVCNNVEFNDLISQMETNFGKCKQSYSDYKLIESTKDWLGLGSVKRFDYEPAKSDKELEVMDIDWSKAPEGATHYGYETEKYNGGFYKIISSDRRIR